MRANGREDGGRAGIEFVEIKGGACKLRSSLQNSLTKAQQMGRAGPQLPPKKCAVIITTFFGTKPLCSHGYA